MIGQKITKPVSDWNDYTQAALWCNTNKATIKDKGDYYEVIALPERPLEEAKTAKLTEPESIFLTSPDEVRCLSSASFETNADEIANRNIER